jgi:DNA mismatch endonuclease (patch repair protein)
MVKSRDKFTSRERSWIMSRVKSRDTTPEIRLRRELWKRGLRYRVVAANLPGKPDIVFPRARVVVFVDGEFWHGHKLSAERLNQMSDYWREKIRRNAERDESNTKRLEAMGYVVLRFLDRDVLRNAPAISLQIEKTVRTRPRPVSLP